MDRSNGAEGVSQGAWRQPVKTMVRAAVPRSVRNWLRSPAKSAKWLWNWALFAVGRTKTAQLFPDWNLRCHPQAYEIVVRDWIRNPEQRAELANFMSHCSGKMLFFDAGAHFGMFSLAAAHLGGTAVAIEPSPTATRIVTIQAALNGLTDKIHIVRAAVSDTSGTLGLLTSGPFSEGYFQVASGRPDREMTRVPATTIDELVAQFGVPSHIKIDVEGHEAAAIRGGRATLAAHSPLLFLELHTQKIVNDGGDPNSVLNELDLLGYAAFSTDGVALERDAVLAKPVIRFVAKRRA